MPSRDNLDRELYPCLLPVFINNVLRGALLSWVENSAVWYVTLCSQIVSKIINVLLACVARLKNGLTQFQLKYWLPWLHRRLIPFDNLAKWRGKRTVTEQCYTFGTGQIRRFLSSTSQSPAFFSISELKNYTYFLHILSRCLFLSNASSSSTIWRIKCRLRERIGVFSATKCALAAEKYMDRVCSRLSWTWAGKLIYVLK